MLHGIRASSAIRTFLHRLTSKSAQNCCTAMNLQKAIALCNRVSTLLPSAIANSCRRYAVDTAAEISHRMTPALAQ